MRTQLIVQIELFQNFLIFFADFFKKVQIFDIFSKTFEIIQNVFKTS